MSCRALIEGQEVYELEGAFLHYPWDEFYEQFIAPYEHFIEGKVPSWYMGYGELWEIPHLNNLRMFDSVYKDGEVVPVVYTFFSPEQAELFITDCMRAGLEDWDYPDCLEKVT